MKIERMLNLAEYKRRQAAPGVKVTLKNFGRDYPIVNRFRRFRRAAARVPTARCSRPRRRRAKPSISERRLVRWLL